MNKSRLFAVVSGLLTALMAIQFGISDMLTLQYWVFSIFMYGFLGSIYSALPEDTQK